MKAKKEERKKIWNYMDLGHEQTKRFGKSVVYNYPILVLCIICFFFAAFTAVASAEDPPCACGDICVNETGWWRDGGVFNTSGTPIQSAVDNATTGETICVKDGTYNENVDVTKSHLTIRSENGPSVTTVSASLNPDDHVFDITDQTNVTLEGFEIRDATGTSQHVAGIYMYNARECNISNNIVTNISATGNNYAYGIRLYYSSDNSFDTTTVYNLSSADDCAYGIYLSGSSDNSFDTSTVYNLDANYDTYGILLSSSSDNNSFDTSTVYNLDANYNAFGILLVSSSGNSFDTSTVYNLDANLQANGIRLYSSSDNSFSSGSISDINAPTWWDFYSDASSQGNSAKDITISSIATTISFTYENGIMIKSVQTPPADPADKLNIWKYVNVTEVTADSWIFMNVSYEEGDLVGVVENSLRMWKHNGTDWTEVPGTNGVNTAENYVYANITEFSVFAPLGNVTGVKLEINKTGVPDPVLAGGTLNYSISVNNTGNATATNVTVTETYDENVNFVFAVPVPSSGDNTWIFPTLNVSETKRINVTVTANASTANGTVLHNIVNVSCNERVADYDVEDTTVFSDAVHITSFAPPSPVNDTVCNWRTFNVSVDQTVNVSWYLNGSLLFTNKSVRDASCRLHADVAGVHNVSAIASNANSSDMQTWIWNVTVGNCNCGDICVNETGWWRDVGAFIASSTPIQHAIENATAGDTICVKDGTYNENVDVTKSHLTIRSENGPSVTTVSASLNPNKHVFKITDQTNVTLEGFEIRDATGTSQHVAGIYMYNARECNISNNIVTNISATGNNYAYGIYLYSSSDNSFDTSTVYNLSSADGFAYGIWLDSSSDNSFDTSTVYNLSSANYDAHGIWLYYSSDNSFDTSTVYNLSSANYYASGIRLIYSSNNSFDTSTVYNLDAYGGAYGIRLDSSSDNSFDTSTTVYNLDANYEAYGIGLDSSSNNNTFSTSTTVYNLSSANYEAYGILLWDSSNNRFDTSTVYNLSANDNAFGIYLRSSSDNNSFDTSTVYNLSANDNAFGILLDSSSDNSFDTSTTVYNLSSANAYAYGIWLSSSSDNNSFYTTTIYNLSSAYGNTYGIWLDSSSDNSFYTSTVYNLDAYAAYGIWLIYSSNNSFDTSTVYNLDAVAANGIWLDSSSDNSFDTSTTVYNLSSANSNANGIYLYSSSNNNSFDTSTVYNLSSANYEAYGILLDSSSDNNSFYTSTVYNLDAVAANGILLDSSSDNNSFYTSTVYNLSANDNAFGILLDSSSGNSFYTSTVYNLDTANGNAFGICLYSSSGNSFYTSTVYLSANYNAYGIYLYSSSDNNSFDTSTVYNLDAANGDAYGIGLESSSGNSFYTSTVYNLSANYNAFGIWLWYSSGNSFSSGSLSDINAPTWWDFYSEGDAHRNSAENITISSFPTTISFTYDNGVGIKSVTTPEPDPADKANISKYVNVTEVTADSWIFMNVSYEDGDLGGVIENSLRMWKHNGTDWTEVPGTNGVNTAENYVYANITEFSVFAPLGNVTGAKLEINKTGVPDPVSPGGTLNYTICVNNSGNATATNVTVMETYDGNVSFVTAVPAPSLGNDTWKFATLNASEARWINISVLVNASVLNGTVLHNVVNVTCDEGVSDSDTEDTTVLFKELNCTCGDICVNETGWWQDGGAFIASGTPIQDAINNAIAGDTICVRDGTYTENVKVNKSLTIHSENGSASTTVQASNSNRHVFKVTTSNVNISGFTATGATGSEKAGIYLHSVQHCNISGNNCSNNDIGIRLSSSSNNNLTGNTASNNSGAGILLSSSSNNNNLTSNTASNNDRGIYLVYSSNNELTSNNASNNNRGIYLVYSSNNELTSNNASNNNRGIKLSSSSNRNTLSGNTASNNSGAGIRLSSSSNRNTLTSNNASNNSGAGIRLSSSSNNLIYNNYFNNTNNAYDDGNNAWNITKTAGTNIIGGPYLGGNYWSDYSGKDLDGDGLGDTLLPYNSSGNIQTGGDWHPLTTVGYAPPEIISFAPPSPVNDTVCNWRTFNVTVNQTVNVSWYLNNSLLHTNESVQAASCTLHADVPGEHNVSAIASNANGSDMQTWIWNVTKAADLVITEKWLCWPENCTICYNVTNIGNGTAHACHNTTLYVDGIAVAHDHVPVDLPPGESYTGCFAEYSWAYTSPSDNITVCADNNETIDELDETNNCLTNIWMCGDVNGDGKVTMSDVRKVFNRYLNPNYPLDLPWAADVNGDGKVTMSDVRKVFNRYLDPGYELNCCCERVA